MVTRKSVRGGGVQGRKYPYPSNGFSYIAAIIMAVTPPASSVGFKGDLSATNDPLFDV